MNRSIPVLLVQRKCTLKVIFIVVYDSDAPCCTSKADGKQCLLLQVPAAPPSSSTQEKTTTLCGTEPIILHDNERSHTTAAVMHLMHHWQWDILEHPPYSPDMSPCNYNLFAKVKEPQRGTQYNTWDELIHAIGQ